MVDQEPGKILCVQLFSYALWCQNWECWSCCLGGTIRSVRMLLLLLFSFFCMELSGACLVSNWKCWSSCWGVTVRVVSCSVTDGVVFSFFHWHSKVHPEPGEILCMQLFPEALAGLGLLVLIYSFHHQKSEVHWEPGEILSLQLFSCICAVKVKICWSGTTKSLMRTGCNNNVRSCCSQWVKAQDLGLRGCRFESWFGRWVVPLLSP